MALITPIIAVQDTVQSTTSTSYTNIGCETAALANGIKYLVFFHGTTGADTNSRLAFLQLLHGATQIAESGGESFLNANIAYNGPKCVGIAVVVGDGTSTLKFQGKTNAGTGRFGAMCIVAIPMTLFGTEGVDWYADYTDSTTKVVNDATAGVTTDVLRKTDWDFGASQDWMVFGSYESLSDAFTLGRSTHTEMTFGAGAGTKVDCDTNREGEDPLDIEPMFVATLETLAGVTEVALRIAGSGASEVDARRPRLVAIRCGAWNQIYHDNFTGTRAQPTSLTYVDAGILDPPTFTPVESNAYVLTLLNGNCGTANAAATGLTQLVNVTAGTNHCIDSGSSPNNVADDLPWNAMVCQQISTPTDYKIQVRSSSAGVVTRYPADAGDRAQIFQWELSVPNAASIDPILMGAVF
jgi:hypothetical protein